MRYYGVCGAEGLSKREPGQVREPRRGVNAKWVVLEGNEAAPKRAEIA